MFYLMFLDLIVQIHGKCDFQIRFYLVWIKVGNWFIIDHLITNVIIVMKIIIVINVIILVMVFLGWVEMNLFVFGIIFGLEKLIRRELYLWLLLVVILSLSINFELKKNVTILLVWQWNFPFAIYNMYGSKWFFW